MNAAAKAEIIEAAAAIRAVEAARVAGELPPVHAGSARALHVIAGMMSAARYMGVTLKQIHAIDARGELSIASRPAKAGDLAGIPFSAEFCTALNTHCNPRCGIAPGAVMEPMHSNWCRVNHFDAERLVLGLADELTATAKAA